MAAMTLQRAMDMADALRPNRYDDGMKKVWLSRLEGRIKTELLDTHEGWAGADFSGFDENTPGDKPLFIQGAHEDVYVKWLMSQIDYHDWEPERYNNSAAQFNAAWTELAAHINRTYMPLSRTRLTGL